MAKKYPVARFIGVDVSSNFPSDAPSNCVFKQHDASMTLPWATDSIDFGFIRTLVAALSKSQYVNMLRELYRCIKPGGYVEVQETSLDFPGVGKYFREFQATCKYLVSRTSSMPDDVDAMYVIKCKA